jgi:integrase
MAKVIRRVWKIGEDGHQVRRVAWGYRIVVDGKTEKVTRADWTKADALEALAFRMLERDPETKPSHDDAVLEPAPPPARPALTFGEAIARYLEVKARKRSWKDDQRNLARLQDAFGADLPLGELTAGRIAEYKIQRARTLVKRDGGPRAISAATLNRELAALRHLFTLAVEEWEVLDKAPRIRLEKEPEGRIVWLEAKEAAALLTACRASQNKHLADVVTVALETGMRQGELLELDWSRVDLSRGVVMLERTKSGHRREIPMRRSVDAIFAAMPEPRAGRVWPDKSIRTAFENAVEAAGLKDFTFHGCRHHFASWFMMRGGQLEALREILGHRDIKMTLRYAHLSPGHLRIEIEKTAANGTRAAHDARIEVTPPVSA